MRHLLLLRSAALLALLMLACALLRPAHAATPTTIFLPLIFGTPPPPNPFGFDLRYYTNDISLDYVRAARPRWTRGGDVLWSQLEPVRGAGYRWEKLAHVEANIRRLRAAGVEPTLVILQSPGWAQQVAGRACSPMKPEYIDDFVNFVSALVRRYASGPLMVNYWEIWNEPEFAPTQVLDSQGVGCWGVGGTYNGGDYYGQVLKRVYPAIKAANPRATVLGGALVYFWPGDSGSSRFLTGILDVGAGDSFDMLSFHAYGEWGAGDLLINKTMRLRQILGRYGLAKKPLFATEIAAMCRSDSPTSCPPDYVTWQRSQANYAARIYAEAIALDLKGALWYTLAETKPGFAFSHLIDVEQGELVPRPAYYAFRNSALLLQGAHYTGPSVQEPPSDQIDEVQNLPFKKPDSALYVLWVPKIDFPKVYQLKVPNGAAAICTDHLDQDLPARYYCSDTNQDGVIWRAVNELPQYVEVFSATATLNEVLPSVVDAPPVITR